ncbi:alpha/beta fold hydrolase [Synechococcus sp. CCY 9618]|uniref:alpha/beta fold hydrolase n=1 Tax=Synechococcus sp. CCY 9618 TaxID=2815602 RepID=UPI001C23FCD8|nr:alpha/beta hydrolase [Synechococcus sp. CCY 9618]
MPDQPLWLRSRELVEEAAIHLKDPRARHLASAVEWWELPGSDERWPVAVLGEGRPLLIIGGFDGSFLDATPLAIRLAKQYRLLIPDVYGFGFCPRPNDGDYSAEGVLHHLEALLACPAFHQAIGTSVEAEDGLARVSVIGASMGTRVAVDLARRQPERIERLMLLGPVGLTEPPVEQPLPLWLESLSLWLLNLHWFRRWLRRLMHAHARETCSAGELEICSVHLATPGWKESLRRFGRSGGFKKSDRPLPAQPILAILGREDRLVDKRQRQLVSNFLGDRIMELPACGHLPQWEHPQQLEDIWNDWLISKRG